MRKARFATTAALALLITACDVTPFMTPNANGKFGMPFPNDVVYRNADGTINMENWPGSWNPLLRKVLRDGSAELTGFGNNSAVFFRFSGPIESGSLPPPEDSTADDATVMLVNIDPDSPAYGTRVPILTQFTTWPTLLRPANLLSVLPYPGFVLDPDTTYAVILFDGVRTQSGSPVRKADLLAKLARPWTPGTGLTREQFDAMVAQRDAVFAYLAGSLTAWSQDDVVAFTMYTTQEHLSFMRGITGAVNTMPAPEIVEPVVVRACESELGVARIHARVDLPRFQAGDYPFILDGGAVQLGPDGLAIIQGTETVNVGLDIPCGPAPADGWPIVMVVDGTGSSYTAGHGFASKYFGEPGALRYLVVAIAPYYSGDRLPPEVEDVRKMLEQLGTGGMTSGDLSSYLFFNWLNPTAGVYNQLQQASEPSVLRRAAGGLNLPAELAATASPITADPERVAYYGHSQGAGTTAQTLVFDTEIDAAFFSAGGAGLYHALVHRRDVRELINQLSFAIGDELDSFHPTIQAMQTIGERGDPANYFPYVDSADVFLSWGLHDGCTPREAVSHAGTAAHFDVAADGLIEEIFGIQTLLGRDPIPLPAGGNLENGHTGLIIQFDAGHFGVHANPQTVTTFFDSFLDTGTASLPAGPFRSVEESSVCRRYDP